MIRDTSSTVLLSLRPKYAELIISVEARRDSPSSVSHPGRHDSLGLCEHALSVARRRGSGSRRSTAGSVHDLEAMGTRHRAGQGRVRRLRAGTTQGHHAGPRCGRPLSNPLALDTLRDRWKPFIAPQSYRFLRDAEFSAILNGERNELDKLIPRRIHRDGGRQSNEPAGGAPGTSGSC